MMELQLGLALPGIIQTTATKGFDLNSSGYDPKEILGSDHNAKKKRSFDEAALAAVEVPRTLPLLVWNNNTQPNLEADDQKELDTTAVNATDGDENGVIGWPPIKSCRKKLCHQKPSTNHPVDFPINQNSSGGGSSNGGGGRGANPNSKYVKVKMEGVAIGRKVDPSLHQSYQALTHTLVGMFGKCQENVKAYKLTYQDMEGDWLLAGDVPWGTFIHSVRRLKLLKINV